MTNTQTNTETTMMAGESFADLLAASAVCSNKIEGTVVQGTVISIDKDIVTIDVGLKSEGRVSLREFAAAGTKAELKPGDKIEVYVERMEDRDGLVQLSREKARREESWVDLEKAFQNNERVNGVMFGKVKGGFTVDLGGAIAFLPGSQVDVRPIRDTDPLMGIEQPFQILKMDRARGNIVVSRRAVMEESRTEARGEIIANLGEGQVLEGLVKNITDYGAFIDLGGVDGLLHVTDISWRRVNHPSDVLHVGQKINVQVIRFNSETQRISLGMKQLEDDPWKGIEAKYPVEAALQGTVTNITDYGAFIEIEDGVEGLAHVSDMSWTKKGAHPSQFVSVGQKVNVKVLSIDSDKRRIALGMKQCIENPWEALLKNFKAGEEHEGEIKNITEFGLFVSMTDDIDGMVHMSDISWDQSGDVAIKTFEKGKKVKVKILDIDPEKERVVLGIKQLENDPFLEGLENMEKGSVVTCEVTGIQETGIDVKIGEITSFIRKAELAKDREERRTDRFAVGEKVDAKVTSVDHKARRVNLSIKAREIDEKNKIMDEYGSTDSGASLGDILGAALTSAKERKEKESANKK
ncbi:MAG: 30S ribosomal protein S1 [Alphaproteobacteria bacterium]|nr:30S ribosomal protein S1 [Alphaproteobacteria bacterium]